MEDIINKNTNPAIEVKPLPSSKPDVMPFNYDLLPPAIGNFVKDTAQRQQCPPDFIAVTALCGLAGVLGNKVCIYPKQNDDWKITPNLWGAVIGRPSAMKSPAMKAALKPLKAIENGFKESYEVDLIDYETDKVVYKLATKNAEKEATKVVDKDIGKATEIIAKANASAVELPAMQRLIVNDTTIEKLGELLAQNPHGLLVVRDELFGWLSRLMKEEYQADRAFYLECFDGDATYRVDRIMRGSMVIEHCTLSLVGGIQPSKIAPLVRGAVSGQSDDGLIQRLQLVVWPDDSKSWKWIDQRPDPDAQQAYENLFSALMGYKPLMPRHMFSLRAQQIFIEWMEELQLRARHEDTTPIMESYLLKLPKSITALALIFQLTSRVDAQGNIEENMLVNENALAMALEWSDYLISHAERLFSSAKTSVIDTAKLIIKRRRKLPDSFKCRDIQSKGWSGLDSASFIYEALDLLVTHNYLIECIAASSPQGGRPSTSYIWTRTAED